MQTPGRPSQWARALHRAEANRVIVVPIEQSADAGAERHYFKARSVSRPDSVTHGIVITCDGAGVQVRCSCEGGQKGLPCMHAAQALRAAGLLPDLMLIEADDLAVAA
jgi:hypothetical protein